MRRLMVGLCISGWVLGCGGPRKPGAVPGETLFWKVTQSEVSFSNCTDDEAFRKDIQPIAFDANTYIIYRVEDDARKATTLACETFNTSTCSPSPSGIVFDVAHTELVFSDETKNPIGTTGCMLQSVQNWLLTDRGTLLDMEVSNVLGLVDEPTACKQVEEQIVQRSPNATGLQGCVVKFTVSAELR